MSLKAELETWAAALKAYDEEDFGKSLDLFSRIADSSKILTNMGLIYATLGEHEAAVERFVGATQLDQYLAVAYFQCGVSNFLLRRFEVAMKNFEDAFLYLRGNQDINYEQLGLKFRLYSAEVLFNKGLSQVYLGRIREGLADMEDAKRDKATEEHNVIDDAIRDRGEGYTVFSIPVGVLYRPSEKKLKNAVTKDYLGKARLVAASDPGDAFTEFTGATRLKQGISPTGVYIEQPTVESGTNISSNLTRSATMPSRSWGPRTEIITHSFGLERSNTTSNSREQLSGKGRSSSLARNPTGSNSPPYKNNVAIKPPGSNGIVRGLSVRRPGGSPPPPSAPVWPAALFLAPSPSLPAKEPGTADFFDDYLDSYTDQTPRPPIRGGAAALPPDHVGNSNTTEPSYPLSRSGSQSAPARNYSSSRPSLRRKPTRRPTTRSRGRRNYEEEEGYVSGDYEDSFEIIRIKIHYQDDVRGMTLNPRTAFEEFVSKLATKFGKNTKDLSLKFEDEDGVKVSLKDESDYELAIETARSTAKGKAEGKLEIWCIER